MTDKDLPGQFALLQRGPQEMHVAEEQSCRKRAVWLGGLFFFSAIVRCKRDQYFRAIP